MNPSFMLPSCPGHRLMHIFVGRKEVQKRGARTVQSGFVDSCFQSEQSRPASFHVDVRSRSGVHKRRHHVELG